ncbi:MAG: ABC transporter ATP-binding protein [Candidatus Woesearchaeota archaeon]
MSEKPRRIDFNYNWRIYLGFLKKYRIIFFILLVIILIVEATYVADRYIFKLLVDNGTEFSAGTMTLPELEHILLLILAFFVGLIVIRAISKWLYHDLITRIETQMIVDLKTHFFNHIINLSHKFHTTHRTGSMISRLTRGSRAIEKMTDVIAFNVAPLIFQLIIVSGAIMMFDLLSGLIVFFTVAIFILYSFIINRLQEPSSIKANDAEDFEKGQIADMFTNIDSIKGFGKEEYIKNKYKKYSEETKAWMIKNWNFYRWTDSGQSIIINIGIFFLIYIPLIKFMNHELSLGTIVFIYTAFLSLTNPLYGFVFGLREYFRVMADFQSLFEYGKISQEVKDAPNAKPLKIKKGIVEFKNVTFNYGTRTIFKNFNLKISQNKKIALVGHSGSGKTTLVKILYRLYDVNEGSILIDGKDIREVHQESLRSEMSNVPQECLLFDDTIYNNILFSRPEATREEVLDAIRFAQLDNIINEFPQKENTIVGERGVKLSGGEKQRVSIARAILANKKILILDEATSSLDSQTERDIQKDLQRLMKGRTSIIIAHRLSTIMSADTIIVLKKGQIAQMGTHKQLIQQKGEYKKLWNLQKGGYLKT